MAQASARCHSATAQELSASRRNSSRVTARAAIRSPFRSVLLASTRQSPSQLVQELAAASRKQRKRSKKVGIGRHFPEREKQFRFSLIAGVVVHRNPSVPSIRGRRGGAARRPEPRPPSRLRRWTAEYRSLDRRATARGRTR